MFRQPNLTLRAIIPATDPPWWSALDNALSGDVDPIELLSLIGRYQRWLAALEKRTVEHARRSGASWEDVGTTLGITRQSAWGRFARQTVESSTHSPDTWILAPRS